MKNSPVSEIQYDESKSRLIIRTTSKDMQKKLSKELQRTAYETARDRGVSEKITVNITEDAIYLGGNLYVALAHLSCQRYVDLDTLTNLRTQIAWAKYGMHPLISAPRPIPKAEEKGENAVVIHTWKPAHK